MKSKFNITDRNKINNIIEPFLGLGHSIMYIFQKCISLKLHHFHLLMFIISPLVGWFVSVVRVSLTLKLRRNKSSHDVEGVPVGRHAHGARGGVHRQPARLVHAAHATRHRTAFRILDLDFFVTVGKCL